MAILNKNKEERQQDAQSQDDMDMAFEKSMQRKLNSLVNTVVNDFAILYATTGTIVNTDNYKNEIEAIFRQTYRKVNAEFSMVFENDLIEEQAKAKTESRKKELSTVIGLRNKTEPIILASLIAWSHTQAPAQSGFVVDTWNKIINKNVNDTTAQNILDEKPTDNATIAKATKAPLKDELKTHNEVVSMQEVQTATENAKHTEVVELNKSIIDEGSIQKRIEKTWITMGDLNVRDTHARANNQRRELNDPFLVGGEFLRYPKDTSLGASLGNVINCRCKSIYQ